MINTLKNRRICIVVLVCMILSSCGFDSYLDGSNDGEKAIVEGQEVNSEVENDELSEGISAEKILTEKIYVDFSAPYATYSMINDGYATLYKHNKKYDEKKDVPYGLKKRYTVAVNAGHGTKGGSKIKTFSHPDFSPKVTGGTNEAGAILSSAISDGTVLNNGMKEADVNLLIAMALKEKLLDADFDVLMIRENDDARLDNIARTVIANENADCHIAIHMDSTKTDKGVFYISPINNEEYLNMEPLKSNVKNIKALGNAIIEAFKEMDENVWKEKGILQGDLTQLSYSTNASVDIELGDKATEITEEKIDRLAEGVKNGIIKYFQKSNKIYYERYYF